jgi:hypothetical protein
LILNQGGVFCTFLSDFVEADLRCMGQLIQKE